MAQEVQAELAAGERRQVWRHLEQFLPFVTLTVMVIGLAVSSPAFRARPVDNMKTVLMTSSYLIVAAAGMTMVIVSAGIDLSVGSVMAFAGIVGAIVAQKLGGDADPAYGSCVSGVAAGVLAGGCAGVLTGLCICLLRIPSFVVTLGGMGIFRGLALILSNGQPVSPLPGGLNKLWQASFLAVPVPLWVVAAVVIFITYLMRYTLLGRYTYAIGSNAEAAKLSGISITWNLVKVYGINGALAGLAGVMLVARLQSGQPSECTGYELYVIAGVVIGGASLAGGVGTVIGALIGTLIMQLLTHGCVLLQVDDYWQKVLIGLIIIAAVAFDEYRRRVQAT